MTETVVFVTETVVVATETEAFDTKATVSVSLSSDNGLKKRRANESLAMQTGASTALAVGWHGSWKIFPNSP